MTDYFTNDPKGLKKIKKRTRLYKVDSFWFLENYHVNKIKNRFGVLYDELYKTYPNFKKTINVYELEIDDIPYANGIKTILDTYFILKNGSITSPLSVNYNKWREEFGIEPGGKRAALLPYLPRHDFYIAVFHRFQYIDAKYEVDISALSNHNLKFYRQPVHTLDNPKKENKFYDSLIDVDWRSKMLNMCKEQKIVIHLEDDKVYINNDLLLYRQGDVHLCAKNLFEEYTRKKNDKSNTST